MNSMLLILYFCFVLPCSTFFNDPFANAVRFVYLVLCIEPKCPQQFFIAKQFLLKIPADCYVLVNASNYVHQDVCKVKAHSSGIICGSIETYFKVKCILMIKIHHE